MIVSFAIRAHSFFDFVVVTSIHRGSLYTSLTARSLNTCSEAVIQGSSAKSRCPRDIPFSVDPLHATHTGMSCP